MPAGFQCWDENGTLLYDTTTNMGRILGTISTGGVNGSLSVPAFSQGTPFAFPVLVLSDAASVDVFQPLVTISGTTLSWTYPRGSGQATIVYGTY